MKYHSDLKTTKSNLYDVEESLVALAAKDPYYLGPLSKLIYLSGREIDDSLMFYKSSLSDNMDFEAIMKQLPPLILRDEPTGGLEEELLEEKDFTAAAAMLNALTITVRMNHLPTNIGEDTMAITETSAHKEAREIEKGPAFKLHPKDKEVNSLIFQLNEKRDGMHEDAIKEIESAIRSICNLKPESSDYPKLFDYLSFCASLSFGHEMTDEDVDPVEVRKSMDETHFGLKEAKERIIEQLAVNKLNEDANAPRFLMVGGAGTGKTSLANSIGKALGRKVQRVALGGIKDVTTLKGHGRTYLGSKAGVIMNAIMKAGVDNPVLILDEVDKMGEVGSAESVLLELLDPEQNTGFVDSYLNFPYDLSKVLIICTANYPHLVDAPILDRLEMIRTEGYLLSDKVKIAQNYVLPKKMKALGLKDHNIKVSKPTIKWLVESYTREAGVRRMEQAIEKVLRGAILPTLADPKKCTSITKTLVRKRLGDEYFTDDDGLKHEEPGIATGLYYNGMGGGATQMEIVFTRAAGEFKMTGEAGSMLQNSYSVAKTVVENLASILGLDVELLDEVGVHGQLGDGSTPTDGPSAGILFTTTLVSLLADKPVKDKLAMTGEIFLSGRVGAIGGLDEKIPGGYRAGMREFIVPKACERALKDVPKEIMKKVKVHTVSHIDEVLEIAFGYDMKTLREEFEAACEEFEAAEATEATTAPVAP